MAARVAVFHIKGHKRSELVAFSMLAGIRKTGDDARLVPSLSFRAPDADIAVFYGFEDSLQRVFTSYRAAGKTVVFVDLGYWGRIEGGKFYGYHKISVNDRHPTAYFQNRKHDDRRVSKFNLSLKGWRAGRSILLAGMSGKGALVAGHQPEEWERQAIARLRQYTDRPIIYRPKPSWRESRPIEGVEYDSRSDVADALRDCHAVVTHHSNVAVDGLISGVPAFCVEGVASPLALPDLSQIETPKMEGDRRQWMSDISYCQFNIAEMSDGTAWRHLKSEGLI